MVWRREFPFNAPLFDSSYQSSGLCEHIVRWILCAERRSLEIRVKSQRGRCASSSSPSSSAAAAGSVSVSGDGASVGNGTAAEEEDFCLVRLGKADEALFQPLSRSLALFLSQCRSLARSLARSLCL